MIDLTDKELLRLRPCGKTSDGLYGWHEPSKPLNLIIGNEEDYQRWRKLKGRHLSIKPEDWCIAVDADLNTICREITNAPYTGARLRNEVLKAVEGIRGRKI